MLRYVELSSQYRNRKNDPLPSNFTIEVFSNNNQERAVDPICETAPIMYWQNSLNETQNLDYIDIDGLDVTFSTTDTTIIDIFAKPDTLRRLDKFYNGAVLAINDGTITPSPVTDGLVLNLDARFASSYPGTGIYWYDISGNGNTAKLVNNPTFISNREGFFFNSNLSQYATIPDTSSLNPTTSLTIEAYVYCKQLLENGYVQTIFEKALLPNIQYGLYIAAVNQFRFTVGTIVRDALSLINQWVRLAVTYNSITGKFTYYVNQDIVIDYSIQAIPLTTNPLNIATNSTLSDFFGGNILVIRVYDRDLNEQEMLQNYYNLLNTENQYIRRRILSYKYLTPTTAEMVLYPPPLPDNLIIISAVIERPSSDTSADTVPRFFIPRGLDIPNYYVNYYLQNLDFGEARQIIGYDAITHMATLDKTTDANWLSQYEWSWEGGSAIPNTSLPNQPKPRTISQNWLDFRNRVWIYGGKLTNYVGPPLPAPPMPNDLWRLNEDQSWTEIIPASSLNVFPVYGTQGVGDPANTPGSRGEAITWIDLQGNFWLYSGRFGGSVFYGDMWKFDGQYWIWVSGPQTIFPSSFYPNYGVQGITAPTNYPGSRFGSVSWVDYDGTTWLFGGQGYDVSNNPGKLSDIWKWDGQYWTWMYGSNIADEPPIYAGPNATPGGRGEVNGPTIWWYTNSILWIYGGPGKDSLGSDGMTEDVWKWDGTKWTFVFGRQLIDLPPVYNIKGVEYTTNNPGGRRGSSNWVDTQGNLWVFGGQMLTSPFFLYNDMWKFDVSSELWTWVGGDNAYIDTPVANYGTLHKATSSTQPGPHCNSTCWTDLYGNLWMYGGYEGGAGGGLTDIWKFRPSFGNFTLRKQLPLNYGQIIGVDGYNLTLQNALYESNYYINSYVRIIDNRPNPTLGYSIDPPPYAETRRIIRFDSLTLTAVLENTFSVSPLGMDYEILPFTRDNYQVMVYPYSREENMVHDVRLISLRIPNQKLINGNGKTCLDYPYLYVAIKNSNQGHTLVFSNNPNSTNMSFCVVTSDVVYTKGPFIVITYTEMTQRIQIDPRYNLQFSVHLPNGALVQFEEQDTSSPVASNPLLQISAVFEFRKAPVISSAS